MHFRAFQIHAALSLLSIYLASTTLIADDRPNVIVIVADDLGYGDVGFNGPCDIPTPNLDALARSGAIMTSGYASHPYCSPSRAGLLTGRYQQRFGHECNPGAPENGFEPGLPVEETLIADVMLESGYRTAMVGKWHLGDAKQYWPNETGFDEWFGFSGGGLSYWGTPKKGRPLSGVMRNGELVNPKNLTYLTDDFSRESIEFVERNRENPFFLYLAYNAPHAPDHATQEHLQKVRHIEYGGRAVYGAMVAAMDEGIGRLMQTLKELNLRDNTVVFFYSDNGGRIEHASNLPLRGHKGMLFEGGIRVPFCVSWPSKIQANTKVDEPISALDIFPTILAASDARWKGERLLDGVNLLPALVKSGAEPYRKKLAQRKLYWRYSMSNGKYGYAIRDGDYKLIMTRYKNQELLFNLKEDPGERHNLAAKDTDRVIKLRQQIKSWDANNRTPLWSDPHGVNVQKEELRRTQIIKKSLPPKSKQKSTK